MQVAAAPFGQQMLQKSSRPTAVTTGRFGTKLCAVVVVVVVVGEAAAGGLQSKQPVNVSHNSWQFSCLLFVVIDGAGV